MCHKFEMYLIFLCHTVQYGVRLIIKVHRTVQKVPGVHVEAPQNIHLDYSQVNRVQSWIIFFPSRLSPQNPFNVKTTN